MYRLLVDYSVGGVGEGGVATDGVSSHIKRVLIDCWAHLSQDTLNRAIDQLPNRLMMGIKAKGAHVEFRLD